MYVLDTNIRIYFFKGIGNVSDRLLSRNPNDISVAAISLFELEVGIAKSNSPDQRKKQLEALISRIDVIPFAAKEAKAAAMIRANFENKGTPIGPFDTLIAGTALSKNAILVTHNIKEFNRVNELVIEDWY